MSWFGGYKPKLSEPESRELRRQRLEAERLKRKEDREARQKQLQSAQKAQEEAEQALQDLLNLDPDILTEESLEISESEINSLLAEDTITQNKMEDFETENGIDGEKVMDKL